MRAPYVVGRLVYVRVGQISIVYLANLEIPTMFPTSACWDALRTFSLDIVYVVLPQTLLRSMYC